MKKFISIALGVVTVFILVSCVSVQGWEMTENEQASVEVLGSVKVQFHSYQWFHIPRDRLIENAYKELWLTALMQYGGGIDIRNIEITGGFSGLSFFPYLNYPIFGHFQKITATADVVRFNPGSGGAVADLPSFPKTAVGFNANPAGLLLYGSSVCIEFTNEKINYEMNFIIPSGLAAGFNPGFGFLFTINGFWPSRIGGFYLGGGGGFIWQKDSAVRTEKRYIGGWGTDGHWETETKIVDSHFLTWGLNLGYKFITNSGMYYRLGSYIGMGFDGGSNEMNYFYAKPDLSIGWTMR